MVCSGVLPIDQMRDHVGPISHVTYPSLTLVVCVFDCVYLYRFVRQYHVMYWRERMACISYVQLMVTTQTDLPIHMNCSVHMDVSSTNFE